ncbi:hypothetical protein MNBD_GAMMA02-153, partial [hydrothermal vent metagenome]
NVFLHLLIGVFLFFLIRNILRYHKTDHAYQNTVAFWAAAFWLLHPFLVSTTLYVVQRMAMLPLLFILLGMLMYLKTRIQFNQQPSLKLKLLLFVSVFGSTGLAILSKENGVLCLPMLALFEIFILQKYLGIKPLPRNISRWLFALPIVLIVVAFIIGLFGFMERYDVRDFTAYERQLTQFRALMAYLHHLLVPEYFTYGVFTDGFPVSRGWLQPVSTLLSLLALVALVAVAWFMRNRWVWFSFSVFFFLLAHSIESTVIPLEMYFEHRNYVASVFLAVPLLLWLMKLASKRDIMHVIPMILLAYLAFTTHLRVALWSDSFKLHELTMDKYPESTRAYTMTADFYARSGYVEKTMSILLNASKQHDNLKFKLNLLQYMCGREETMALYFDDIFAKLMEGFKTVRFMQSDIGAFTSLYRKLLREGCGTDQDFQLAEQLYLALLVNPYNDREYASLINDAYGVYYYIAVDDDQKTFETLSSMINNHQRYLDVFEGFDELLDAEKHQLIQRLLVVLNKNYDQRFKYKPDLKKYKEKIATYENVLKEKLNEA